MDKIDVVKLTKENEIAVRDWFSDTPNMHSWKITSYGDYYGINNAGFLSLFWSDEVIDSPDKFNIITLDKPIPREVLVRDSDDGDWVWVTLIAVVDHESCVRPDRSLINFTIDTIAV